MWNFCTHEERESHSSMWKLGWQKCILSLITEGQMDGMTSLNQKIPSRLLIKYSMYWFLSVYNVEYIYEFEWICVYIHISICVYMHNFMYSMFVGTCLKFYKHKLNMTLLLILFLLFVRSVGRSLLSMLLFCLCLKCL